MIKKAVIHTIRSILIVCLYYVLQITSFCIFACMLSLAWFRENDFIQSIKKANEMMNHYNNIVYILTSCSALFILLLLLKKSRKSLCRNLKNNKIMFKKSVWMLCLGMAASYLINIIINIIGQVNDSQVFESENRMNVLLYCIGTIVVATVVEEIIYREIIFRDLMSVSSLPFAILVSSLLFAVSHGNFIQFIYTFWMGSLFALLLYMENSVLYSIIAHAGFNLTAGVLFFLHEISIYWAAGGAILSIVLISLSVRQVILLNASPLKKGDANELLY